MLTAGVYAQLRQLAEKLDVHVLSADTRGTAREQLHDLPSRLHILTGSDHDVQMIFDCEFGGKKGRIVVKCEPENPAKVTKEELDEAIKQAADYLENELKAGRKPRRRYRLNNGQMFRQ